MRELWRRLQDFRARTGARRRADADYWRDLRAGRRPPTVAEVLSQVSGVVSVTYPEPSVDPTLLPRPSLAGLEAACRERMAAVARHGAARGFDSARVRAALLAQADHALDLYNLASSAFDDLEELVP